MLVSTGLVLFMVPGLALFYGGMVRRKNVLGTMMHSMVALAIIGIQWVLFGYALAFGESQRGLIGWDTDFLGLRASDPDRLFRGRQHPHLSSTACIRACSPSSRRHSSAAPSPSASASGLTACSFSCGPAWSMSRWLTGSGRSTTAAIRRAGSATRAVAGWLGACGALDFAGGTVVHIAAGVSGLAAILVLRKRLGYPEHAMHPNSMVLTLIGAGLLWFGWFGFNGGSALAPTAHGRVGAGARRKSRRPRRAPELDGRGMAAQGQADRAGFRLRPRRRAGGRHAGVGFCSAPAGAGDWPHRRRRLLRLGLPQALLGTTIRSTPSASTASAAFSARC